MMNFTLNGLDQSFTGDPEQSLLTYLRDNKQLFSVKDGCSGEGVCGACTIEMDGRPMLACRVKMSSVNGKEVYTLEGLPEEFRNLVAGMFARHGAVQCGFCSPGFIMRSRRLFQAENMPERNEIIRAVRANLCRCTGYIKIVDALEESLRLWFSDKKYTSVSLPEDASVGSRFAKYQSVETALGQRAFTDDIQIEGVLHASLRFSDHPRARILGIDVSEALSLPGVKAVFTAEDVPGERYTGLIVPDWPLMIARGEITRYVGDVLAVVVADAEKMARHAAQQIKVSYEVLACVDDVHKAIEPGSIQVHPGRDNVLENCHIRNGDTDKAFSEAAWVSEGVFQTQRIEHAFLEVESALALPEKGGLRLYSQGQGVYVDRRGVAAILGLDQQRIRVTQVPNGGGFGGKEDLSVQGHVSLCAWLLQKPVRLKLSREESIRMHPKRHPVWMKMALAADKNGKLTGLRLKALGDTGAYASVGTKVMERVVGHASGGYSIASVDIEALTVYTNNLPAGAMRGFGVPQVIFALESCIDDICRQAGFDRWQIRYDNALEDGLKTATGQKLEGVGLKACLEKVKETFQNATYAGLACGLKNTGVGNGMNDESEVIIRIEESGRIRVQHGWTEMGQGVHTICIQTLFEETGLDPSLIDVETDTMAGLPTGMTTSSRATALVGNAVRDAAKKLQRDLKTYGRKALNGRVYRGKYICDWTCKPGDEKENPRIHFAYGYAAQVVILNEQGEISRVVAAHDAGRIMNRMLFEGQIEGAVHMGLGYALTEDLPMKDGHPVSYSMKDLGILRADQMPEVEVIGIEVPDPFGPYGAKGIGEIGMVPTAAAVANVYTLFDGKRRFSLPLGKLKE